MGISKASIYGAGRGDVGLGLGESSGENGGLAGNINLGLGPGVGLGLRLVLGFGVVLGPSLGFSAARGAPCLVRTTWVYDLGVRPGCTTRVYDLGTNRKQTGYELDTTRVRTGYELDTNRIRTGYNPVRNCTVP